MSDAAPPQPADDLVQRLRAHAAYILEWDIAVIEAGHDRPDAAHRYQQQLAFEAAADEIVRLRQAIWDAFIIMGGDSDGDESHNATTPAFGWPQFLRDLATEWRNDYDEALGGDGPKLTDAERAVLDAAEAETDAEDEYAKWQRGPRSLAEPAHRALRAAQYARRAAVRARRGTQP